MARNKTHKVITAGLLVIEAIYPRAERPDSDRARAAKRKASSEAQKRLNARHSWEKLERLAAANYRPGDLWVTVTYDDDHLPQSRKEAEARFDYFLQKLRRERGRMGQKVVCISNTEHKHDHEDYFQNRRWHHHFFLNATGDDFELIRRCWIYGDNIEIKRIRLDKENTFEALARYMCKEAPDKVGLHPWRYTRSTIQQPEVDTRRVDSDEQIRIPRGALLLQDERGESVYSKWRVVKYLLPGWDGSAVRAKHRAGKKRR